MSNFFDRASIGKQAALGVIVGSACGYPTLLDRLSQVGLVGDYAGGEPGWIDWERLGDAEALLDATLPLSSGARAVLRVAAALAGLDDELPVLDDHNRQVLATELDAVQHALRGYDALLGRGV